MIFNKLSFTLIALLFLSISCSEPFNISDKENADENVFRVYDAVKAKVKTWNESISNHQTDQLIEVYSSNVDYYLNNKSSTDCIALKKSWLEKHPEYSQSIKFLEVYHFEVDRTPDEFIAEFDKLCTENGKTTTVHSFLHFKKFNGEWLIYKESDVATEIAIAKKSPNINLPNGHYGFERNYWVDTRDVEGFAHETVPYRTYISFDILNETITGRINWYSGTMRSSMDYLIVAGIMENGLLTLDVIYNPNEEYSLDQPEDFANMAIENWRFKIVDNHRLVGVSKNLSLVYGLSFESK